jgi:hypothetical protein
MYLLLPIMLHSLLPKMLHHSCHFCCTHNYQKLCILNYRLQPIISTYQNYWGYIKIVLYKTELGRMLRTVDTKGTIDKKIKDFSLNEECSDSMVSNFLFKLFPEIYG